MSQTTTRRPAGPLEEPHHDGSELYVSTPTPGLGEHMTVRLRVPLADESTRVFLRSVIDGEPHLVAAHREAGQTVPTQHGPGSAVDGEAWFSAELLVHNPVTNYRFLVDYGDGRPLWVNGVGTYDRDVTDAFDFRVCVHQAAPSWSRDNVAYQIFPDRFARSADADDRELPQWALAVDWETEPIGNGPETPRQFYGGDLRGIEERLDHLSDLGVGTVYLTPIFPAGSNHRYDAKSFDHVDELLGGDNAFASLAGSIHARGMRLVGDVTTNHTGVTHEWFESAVGQDSAPEKDFYYWFEYPHDYAHWLHAKTLPKLKWDSPELVSRFLEGNDSVIGRWLQAPYLLDGWRVDVANMTGRHGEDDMASFVAKTMRRTMSEISEDSLLIAEHFHDPAGDMGGDGWQANMNYSGFTRPVWTWLAPKGSGQPFLGLPIEVPRRPGSSAVATMREFASQAPWQVTSAHWNNLSSHDTPRIRTLLGSAETVELAAALLFTYPGTPMIYAGDEWGLTGTNGEHGRVAMPWDDEGRQDSSTYEAYRALIALRNEHRALRHGGLRWAVVEDDAIGYIREVVGERILVVVARAAWSGRLPSVFASGDAVEYLYGSMSFTPGVDGTVLGSDGPAVGIWRLPDDAGRLGGDVAPRAGGGSDASS